MSLTQEKYNQLIAKWKLEVLKHFLQLYFMSHPNNWLEMALKAAEKYILKNLPKNLPVSSNLEILTETSSSNPTITYSSEISKLDPEYLEYKKKLQLESYKLGSEVSNSMNKAGNIIGNIALTATDFTPLWAANMAGRTGLALYNDDYKGAAEELVAGVLAPYAIGKIGKEVIKNGKYLNNFVKDVYITNKLNKQIKNTKLKDPTPKLDLQDGYLFHSGHVDVRPAGYNGKKFTYILKEARPGALKIEDGKYKSVRPPYGDNPDLLWWDAKGHNYGKKVYVTKLGDDAIHVISNIKDLPIAQIIERYSPNYYVTELKPINSVIEYTFDPISRASIPHMPDKVLNNKMSYEEILALPILLQSKTTPTKISLAFFERPSAKISEAERFGIPKGERNLPYKRKNNDILSFYRDITEDTELGIPKDRRKLYTSKDELDGMNPIVRERQLKTDAVAIKERNSSPVIFSLLKDSKDIIRRIKKYLDSNDVEINTGFLRTDGNSSEYIREYRKYMANLGYDTKDLSDKDIAKLLTLLYNDLISSQSGKLKGLVWWHSTPRYFNLFDFKSHLGDNTGNMGYVGPANYFSHGRANYGNYKDKWGYSVEAKALPYLITNIKSTPTNKLLQDKEIISQYLSPDVYRDKNAYKEIVKNLSTETPFRDMAIIDITSFKPSSMMGTNNVEIGIPRNTGIKSLYPHPSLFSENPNSSVSIIRNWDDPRVNYKQGGKLNYLKHYK